jgi:hypothetical protein
VGMVKTRTFHSLLIEKMHQKSDNLKSNKSHTPPLYKGFPRHDELFLTLNQPQIKRQISSLKYTSYQSTYNSKKNNATAKIPRPNGPKITEHILVKDLPLDLKFALNFWKLLEGEFTNEKSVTKKELKSAYRKLARKLHPDTKSPTLEVNYSFEQLNQDYKEILGFLRKSNF